MNKISAFLLLVLLSVIASGCMPPASSTTVISQEQERQLLNQSKYANDVPDMGNSNTTLERTNLNRRMELWNDPNKIGYLYELSDTGTIVAFYVIKGKVSNLNSYLTGSQVPIDDPRSYPREGYSTYNTELPSLLVESPDYDGSFGENGDGIFFFLTDGTYMEWNGKYQLSDRPVKLSVEPLMTIDVKE